MVEYLVDHGANVVALNADGSLPVDLVEEDEDLKNYLLREMDNHGELLVSVSIWNKRQVLGYAKLNWKNKWRERKKFGHDFVSS